MSKNYELADRAAFMAAKREQNMYFTSKNCTYYKNSRKIPQPPDEYRKYFRLIKAEYKETEFYQQIIEECKFFRAYAAKG